MKVIAYAGLNLTPQQTIRYKKLYDMEAMDAQSRGDQVEPFEEWVKAYVDAENADLDKGYEKATGVKKMKKEEDYGR